MLKLGPLLVWLTGLVLVAAVGLGASAAPGEAQSSRHEIRATVMDEEGRLIDGLWVAATPTPYGVAPGEYQGRSTATGSVRFQLVAGVYSLALYTDRWGQCTVSGLENPEGRLKAAFVAEPGALSRISIVVGARNALPSAGWVPCNFDIPFYRIEGTVLRPDQEPLEGIDVRLYGRSGGDDSGPWTAERTGPDGMFTIDAPQGSYWLELAAEPEGGGVCRLGQFGAAGRPAQSGGATRLAITDEDVSGIAITLPHVPSELCHEIQGVVTDARGEPAANLTLSFLGQGATQTPTTDAAGTFSLYLRDGDYRVWITTDLGSDCRIEGYKGAAPGRGSSIVVDGGGVSGLRLTLSGEPRVLTTNVKCPYPEMIATELHPGWNLAGWTGPATNISAVLEATPQLEAIYSWDGKTQSFRGAIRAKSGIDGSLKALEPGMGLWLYIGGTERVSWTRPFLTESALVSLAEGWNLMSWGGRDGASPEDILNPLGAELVLAATWDATTGQFLLSSTATPATSNNAARGQAG